MQASFLSIDVFILFNRLPLLVNKLKMHCSICWMRKLIPSKLINVSFVCLIKTGLTNFEKGLSRNGPYSLMGWKFKL